MLFVLLGNPVVYKGNTFVWEQGRKLASGTMDGKSFSYRYDGNGMRYKKTVSGKTTEYYLDGSQILAEYREAEQSTIIYIYDVSGIAGMIYKGQCYYFDKNQLGDIVGIYNESGQKVGEYVYDAWGNILYKSGSMADINPFRYRGYYYDVETGFYYLQTRYYDPTICRFINADNYELVADLASSMQLNMYAYCGNNPIMYTDPTGEFWDTIGGWFVVLGEGVEWFFDELKIVTDNVIESFYFNAGAGWGFGVGFEVSPLFSFEAMAVQGFGLETLPFPQIGMFERILISLNLLQGLNLSYGLDNFTSTGEVYNSNFEVQMQDQTIGVGSSFFFMFGGYWEFGFNISQFSRLMGW